MFLFLGGLEGSKWAIKNLVNEKIIRLILALDKHFYLSIFMGIIITAIMQSSSAVSVILIGLIEAGVLSLKPAIGIMIGANIGTTVTGQILTYPIVNYYPYLISLGLCIGVLSLFIKKETLFYIGTCLFFYGLIFVGLILMTRFFSLQKKKTDRNNFTILWEKYYIRDLTRCSYYSYHTE